MGLRLSRRPDRTMQIDRASPKILGFIAEVILAAHSIGAADPAAHAAELAGPLAHIAGEVRFAGDDFLPRRAIASDGAGARPFEHLVPVSRGTREEDLLSTAQLVGPRLVGELVSGLGEAFAGELRRATCLGPLRSYPARHLAFAADHDRNWKAGGGYAWDIVRTNAEVREAVNRWLINPVDARS